MPRVPGTLRIAIYAESFPPEAGGIAAAHYGLYHLLRTRHDVQLFAFRDARPPSSEIHRAKEASISGRLLSALATRLVRTHDPAGMSRFCRQIAATVPAVRKLNKQLLLFKPDIIFVGDDSLPALAIRKPRGAKLVWMAHHNYRRFEGFPQVADRGWYDTFLAHRLERRALRKADFAIFPCNYMERVFRETLDRSLAGAVVPNYVDLSALQLTDREAARNLLGLNPDTVLVYLPSAGSEEKGERYMFELMRRLMPTSLDVRFLLSGPINHRLDTEIKSTFSAQQVMTPGKLPLKENLAKVAAADLVVSPTLVENFSCALLEAQALGMPCVTFDTGGNAELVDCGKTGFIVPYLDVEGLVERAACLVANRELRQQMGESARRHAQNLGNAETLKGRYDELFAKMLEL